MKTNYPTQAEFNKQSGIALITVMVVLFILTLLGLAATDSSNFQALMVRNNQFRLETFNVSRSEIQDQLNALNTAVAVAPAPGADPTALPAGVVALVDGSSDSGQLLLFVTDNNDQRISTADDSNEGLFDVLFPQQLNEDDRIITQNVAYQRVGGCSVEETTIGSVQCHVVQIDSDAQLSGTNIQSLQSQTFTFVTF